ncbi:MAG TPA: tRNA (N6-threonylcarbamoyladenosine(37)-N6)-methyltransferase TrmO [Sedimenticola thiotaurini]|uniref:tRNA (N6-threonylcarbamoyladenosine(37)-N6)-methyltransferase TrmO n=1 Tax=Sedimenticola thiotaurini TaxID=1543721 RepID=A0A831RPN8_9GAMM|nr:tRNA (N6-threonylcarbamoyladenosine(37)-N6)-methyltransferase TrmO [Sedimenticola thiotaurini]
MKTTLETIGIIHSPFKEKFGIPRQPGLVPEAVATLELLPPYDRPEAVAGLDGYSHVWIQFLFHRTMREQWQPTVRPPRLGGNRRVGVFASRSPFRPNPLGLSVMELRGVHCDRGVELELGGVDLLDGTPVVDIKPYVPYVDSIPDARGGFAPAAPERRLPVRFTPQAERQLRQRADGERVRELIRGLLEIDPRPAYRGEEEGERVFGMRLHDFDLRWRVMQGRVEVLELAAGY